MGKKKLPSLSRTYALFCRTYEIIISYVRLINSYVRLMILFIPYTYDVHILSMAAERDRLVRLYFELGFTQKEILYYLASKHRIVISLRHLKRVLKSLALYRRKHVTDILDVSLFILDTISSTSAHLHGYRCKLLEWSKTL